MLLAEWFYFKGLITVILVSLTMLVHVGDFLVAMLFAVSVYPLLYEVNTPEAVYFILVLSVTWISCWQVEGVFGYGIMSWTAQHDKRN